MNQPSRSKMLASFMGFASICLVATSCTTATTPSTTTSTAPAAAESSASGGSPAPSAASGGSDANPISMGLDKSNRDDADPLKLIQSDQLKTELKITAEQSAKLKEVENDLRAKVTEKYASIKGLDAKAKEEKLKKMGEELNAETKASREKIGTILKPEQIKRMKEIFLQIYGLSPLNYPDFQTELKLTPEQTKQIDGLKETMLTEMRAGWQIPPDDPTKQAPVLTENRKRLDGIAKNARAKTEAVLTAEQKKTLETLKGATFAFKPTKAEK